MEPAEFMRLYHAFNAVVLIRPLLRTAKNDAAFARNVRQQNSLRHVLTLTTGRDRVKILPTVKSYSIDCVQAKVFYGPFSR